MSVPISSGSFANLREPGIRKAFFDSYDEVIKSEAVVPILYNEMKSNRYSEETLSISALGDFEDYTANGQISYDDISEGYKKTFITNEWTKGIRITRAAKDDDLYGIFDALPKQRGIAAARTREKHGLSVFAGAFAGTSGPDSLSLCSTAHTSPVSGVATQSNSGTETLSKTSVSATRLSMAKFYGFNGVNLGVTMDTILVPLDKEEDGWTIISSKGEPETADNNPNFHFGKYKLIVARLLTNQYAWFGIDMRLMKLNLLWFNHTMLELNQDTAFNNYEARYSAYMRYSYGWSNYTFVFGQNATS